LALITFYMQTTAILNILQIVSSTALVGCILLQHRGTGLGGAFGGAGNVYRSKRGVEKVLYRATIVFAVFFIAVALATVLIRK
jgi:preprotein translocase subunit SecG